MKNYVVVSEFKASLVYGVSSRIVRTVPEKHYLEKTIKKIEMEREREGKGRITILHTTSRKEMEELYEVSRNYHTMRQV